jgi:hypothetical protein
LRRPVLLLLRLPILLLLGLSVLLGLPLGLPLGLRLGLLLGLLVLLWSMLLLLDRRGCRGSSGGNCHLLTDHGAVRLPVVLVLGFDRLGLNLWIGHLDLLLVDVTLSVDEITHLSVGPRCVLGLGAHRDHYVLGLLKPCAYVRTVAANNE